MQSAHRKAWSADEDARLIELVNLHGPRDWPTLAAILESRTAKQCRERWHLRLNPTLNRQPISEEEGRQIEIFVRYNGKWWAEIARRLGGRTDMAVKNWWYSRHARALTEPTLPLPEPLPRPATPERGLYLLRPSVEGEMAYEVVQFVSQTDEVTTNHAISVAPHEGMAVERDSRMELSTILG